MIDRYTMYATFACKCCHWPVQFEIALSTPNNYRPCSLAKQGDNALGSVRPSIYVSICPYTKFVFRLSTITKVIVCVFVISTVDPYCGGKL